MTKFNVKWLIPYLFGGGLLFLVNNLLGLNESDWLYAYTSIGSFLLILIIQREIVWLGHVAGIILTLVVLMLPMIKGVRGKYIFIVNWIFMGTQSMLGLMIILGRHI